MTREVIQMTGRGARGESFADIARRTGAINGQAVAADASDQEVIDAAGQAIVDFVQPLLDDVSEVADAATAMARFDKARLYGGGSAPAWLRLLWQAEDDGWAHIYDPTNPEGRITSVDAAGVTTVSSVADGMAGWSPAVQADATKQPMLWEDYFGGLSALGFPALSNNTDPLHFLQTPSPPLGGQSYPLFIMTVSQFAGMQISAVAPTPGASGAYRYVFNGRSPTADFNSAFYTNGGVSPAVMNARGGASLTAVDLSATDTPMDHDAHVHGILYNGASSKIYQDGVVVKTGNLGSFSLTGLTIGAQSATASRETQWHGAIGPILIYYGVPSDDVIARMTALLLSMVSRSNYASHLWIGAGDDGPYTLRASVGATAPDGVYRLAASRFADMRDPIIGEPGVLQPGSDRFLASGFAQMSVEGLRPGTQYYLGVHYEGQLQPWPRGMARTPVVGSASFSAAFASCEDTSSNHVVFDAIRTFSTPLQFFAHLGDHGYGDYNGSDESMYLFNWANQQHRARQQQLFRSMRVPYVWSDHDFQNQSAFETIDDDLDRPGRLAALSAFHKRVPVKFEGGATDPIFYSWQEGRVLFVMTDSRASRTNENAPDDAFKTCLGVPQKAWFKTQIDLAAAEGLAVMWLMDIPTFEAASEVGDGWNRYSTERTELFDYIKAAGLVGRIGQLAGDYHVSAIDDGTNNDFATGGGCPIPTFVASPLDKASSSQIDLPFSEGQVYEQNGQFGVMDVTDEGGDELEIAWTAYRTTSATDPTLIETLSYSWTAVGLT